MKKAKSYENYPVWIILLSNLVSVLIYLIGAIILYKLGVIWLIVYLLFVFWLEIRLLKDHCVNCFYYGKCCAFGKGRLSFILFKKGVSKNFTKKQITWKDILPDFMVSLIPMLVGIIILFLNFNWLLLIMVILLFLLTFIGNAFVRGQLACKYCRQREIGCPAEKLFSKGKK
jgi:hypothetical protein